MKVIVTGASKGIGRGIAKFLAKDGMEVGLLARSQDELESLLEEIERDVGVAKMAVADVRDREQAESGIHSLIEQLDGVDALINNAGLVIRKNVFDISEVEWHALIDTNVCGLFYCTRAVLPQMKKQERGHIINISSISGRVPLPGGSAYAASKYAVTGFTESLFQEVRDFGIKTTLVFPGSVNSESHRHDDNADHSWKVQPEEVGQACRDALRTSHNTAISLLEIRPRSRPPKK